MVLNDRWYFNHLSFITLLTIMKKVLTLLLIIGAIVPSISSPSVEAGVSPEGVHRRRSPRCKVHGKVVVCKMPRRRRCTIKRPCVPRDYYRPNPRRRVPVPLSPMPLR